MPLRRKEKAVLKEELEIGSFRTDTYTLKVNFNVI